MSWKKINIMCYNYTILNLSNYRMKVFIDYFWSFLMIFNTCATSVYSWASAIVECCVECLLLTLLIVSYVNVSCVSVSTLHNSNLCWWWSILPFCTLLILLFFFPPCFFFKNIRFWTTRMSCSQNCPLC